MDKNTHFTYPVAKFNLKKCCDVISKYGYFIARAVLIKQIQTHKTIPSTFFAAVHFTGFECYLV